MTTSERDIEAVWKYIDEHREEYIGLLQSFVRQPSIANTGEGIQDMIKLVERAFMELGAAVTLYPTDGNPVIYATIKGDTDKTFGSYDHYDVMPVAPVDAWIDEPYSGTVHDGMIWGRGTSDNKDGLASKICAADAWLKTHGSVPCNIKYFVEGEEEIGSPHLPRFAAEHEDLLSCDGFNWESGWKEPGGPAQIHIGNKGILYVELRAKTADNGDKHSAYACLIPNAAWRLVGALSTIKDPATDEILIDGFYDDVAPLTKADEEALERDDFTTENFKGLFGVDRLINGLDGMAAKRKYYFGPTANICGICAGYTDEGSKTVLPCTAMAKIDFRLAPGQDPERILDCLKAHLKRRGYGDIEVKVLGGMEPAFRTPPDSPFVKAVQRAAREVFGEEPSLHPMVAGTSPQPIFCAKLGIPSAMFGCISDTNNIHVPNEHMAVQSYIDEIKLMATTFKTLAESE